MSNFRDSKKVFQDPVLFVTIGITIVSLLLFIVWPIYEVLIEGFLTDSGEFTLKYYQQVFKQSDNLQVLSNTLVSGLVVSFLSVALGFLFAYADACVRMRFKKLFKVLAILPIVSPPFALSMSFIMLFGQRGFITHTLLGINDANVYGFTGLVTVQTLTFFPIAYLVLAGLLRQIDPSYEEAAQNMGASRWYTFKTVTLPLLVPGISNSFLLVFIQAVADFGNAMVIGGNYTTLAVKIYLQAMGNYDLKGGTALASILMTISILMFILQKYWVGEKSYVTVTGKPTRQKTLIDAPIVTLTVIVPCFFISAFILLLYILIPYGSLVNLWGIDYTPTLKHYQYMFSLGLKPIIDTTYLALLSMPITGIMGMVIAYLITRKRFFGRGLIEFTSLLSMAIPGTVIGIGYILAYNQPPLVLTGTAIIIVFSFLFRNMPVGIRAGVASLQQIDPSIEEAAQDLGAGSFKVFTSIVLPLIKEAFFGGLIYSFVRSMTAISAVIFLVSASYNLLTVTIMSQVDVGRLGVAAAYSTTLIIIVLAVIGILRLLLDKMGVKVDAFQD